MLEGVWREGTPPALLVGMSVGAVAMETTPFSYLGNGNYNLTDSEEFLEDSSLQGFIEHLR